MDLFKAKKEEIEGVLKETLKLVQAKGLLQLNEWPTFIVEKPRDKSHGDWATNVALLLSKVEKKAPREIAQIIVNNLCPGINKLGKTVVAGPGFINFYLEKDWLVEILPKAIAADEQYGHSNYGQGEKIQVEFVSANPTGLLHMGNARGAALGDTLSNLLAAAGYQVTREFYINDAGNQIENFGKSLEARYLELLGEKVEFPTEGYHGEDLKQTVAKIIAEVGDTYLNVAPELRREFLIEKALTEKLGAIREDLKQFGVEYDCWFSEQSLHESGEIEDCLERLEDSGVVYEKEGALWLELGEDKDEVLVRSNGLVTYFAADIAYHRNKFERGFSKVINIWGADHHGHVARMKGAIQALGYDSQRLKIVLMQLVHLWRGGQRIKMSKRSGTYITLAELIAEVGRDAARFFFVMRSPDSHLDFDLDLAREESAANPVYYVQYAHARIHSILKAETLGGLQPDFTLLKTEEELALIEKIAEFPGEIVEAALNCEPHRLTHYAQELAALFHSFYNRQRVLVKEPALRQARLGLIDAVRITLRNVLSLLGVSAPERM